MLYLDINDYQLGLRSIEQSANMCPQPAAMAAMEGEFLYGEDALLRSRSHPQHFNNKYLYSLAADPISGDLKPAKNHADLIYHNLKHLELPSDDPLVLGVTGQVTNTQLGLLLGICAEAKLDVLGFVDLGLAQSLSSVSNNRTHLLDIELHRMTLTEVQVQDTQCRVNRCDVFDGVGVSNIMDGWMNVIADEFVQKTRFDPLHAGQTEQQLFDQVWQWLGDAPTMASRISIHHGDANRDIEINQQLMQGKLEQRLERLQLDHVKRLHVTPRVCSVPGLLALLHQRVSEIHMVTDEDIMVGYDQMASSLDRQQVRRVTLTEVDQKPVGVETDGEQDAQPLPTHLLQGFSAKNINSAEFSAAIDAATVKSKHNACMVNGSPASDDLIQIGDTIVIDGETYTAIKVE